MCRIKCQAVISLLLFHVSYCQRRIVGGEKPALDQTFMVYFVKASVSPEDYDEWVCGGALITSNLIVTSAACVEDVKYMYAVAGYSRYISDSEIESNPCTTSKMKKKVIMTCVPRSYELDYDKLEKWSFIDIAVAQVEAPYKDEDFNNQCSYIPKPIQVNFEEKYQAPTTDAMVLGWGHPEKWRKEDDSNTYNSQDLLAAQVALADKEECKKLYADYEGMETVIDKYMICSMGQGNINSKGEILVTSAPSADGCAMLNGRRSKTCDDTSSDLVLVENIRRKNLNNMTIAGNSNNNTKVENNSKYNTNAENDSNNNKKTASNTKLFNKEKNSFEAVTNNSIPFRFMNTRRQQGICQNDHGGPIVTWAGGHEILIGVASVFKIASDYKCEGPYLYTSTQCNGAFLHCIMTQAPVDSSDTRKRNLEDEESRRKFCESPPEVKGFKVVKTHISWTDHPHGPSELDLQLNETNDIVSEPDHTFNITTTPSLYTDRPSELDLQLNETNKTSKTDQKLNTTSTLSLNSDKLTRASKPDHTFNITTTPSLNTDRPFKMSQKINITSTTNLYSNRTSKMNLAVKRLNVTSTRSLSQYSISTTSSTLHVNRFITSTTSFMLLLNRFNTSTTT